MNGTPIPILDRPVWRIDVVGHVVNSAGFPVTRVVNVFYYISTTPASPSGIAGAADVKNAFLATVSAEWNAVLPSPGYVPDFCNVRDITSPLNPVFQLGNTLTPGVNGDYDATNGAIFIYKKTGLRGRNYRGGWHFGPVPASLIVGQKLTNMPGGGITLFNALSTKLFGNASGGGSGFVYKPQLFSASVSNLTVNPSLLELNDLRILSVKTSLGSMTRRQCKSEY